MLHGCGMRGRVRRCGAAVCSAAMFAATAASAQEIQEIIVTAQKREQSLQDVSAAVTAIGADRLQSAQIDTIEDMQLIVPSITFGNDFNMAKLFIRGVGANTSTTGSETGVALHVDGAVVARAEAQRTSLFDLERVEVLRGPQGSLYGRNAVGGSINLITAKPTVEPEGYVRLTIGNYEAIGAEGALGGPITDRILGRFAVKADQRGGFGRNPVTGSEIDDLNRRMARLHLNFLLSDSVDLLLTGEYFSQDDASSALKFRRETYPDVPRLQALGISGYAADPRDLASEADPRNETETYSVTSTLRWQINDTFSLTNITNYRDFFSYIVQDLDVSAVVNSLATNGQSTTVQRRDVNSHQASTEFQLNFTRDRLNGVFGLFYFRENQRPVDTIGLTPVFGQASNLDVLAEAGVDLEFAHDMCSTFRFVGRGIAGQTPVPKRACIKTDLDTDVWAVFGQAVYTFGAQEEFSVKVGGRYSHEERSSENPAVLIARGGLGPVVVFTSEPFTPETPDGTHVERDFSDFTPEVGLEMASGGRRGRPQTPLLHVLRRLQGGCRRERGRKPCDRRSGRDREPRDRLQEQLARQPSRRELRGVLLRAHGPADQQDPAGRAGRLADRLRERGRNLRIRRRTRVLRQHHRSVPHERLGGVSQVRVRRFRDIGSARSEKRVDAGGADVRHRSGGGILPAGDPARRQPDAQRSGMGGQPASRIRHSRADAARRGAPDARGGHFLSRRRVLHRVPSSARGLGVVHDVRRERALHVGGGGFFAELWGKNLSDELVESSTFALATARTIGVTWLPPRTYGLTVGYNF